MILISVVDNSIKTYNVRRENDCAVVSVEGEKGKILLTACFDITKHLPEYSTISLHPHTEARIKQVGYTV